MLASASSDKANVRASILFRALAVTLVAVGLLGLILRIVRVTPAELSRNDFTQDYISARAWEDGANPYARIKDLTTRYLGPDVTPGIGPGRFNPHMPISIVLVSPLAHLPYRAARALWLVVTSAALALGIGLVGRHTGLSAKTSIALGLGSLALPISQLHMELVQSEALIVLLLALGWVALDRHEGWAGLSLGIATALRIVPGFMLIPLLRTGKRRAAISMIAAAAAVSTAGGLLLGLSNVHRLLVTASPENFRLWRGSPENLSLVGIPFQWLTRSLWHPYEVNVPWLADLTAIAMVAVAIFSAAKTPSRITRDPYWAAVPFMLLVSPLTWQYSLILMIPVVLLWGRSFTSNWTRGSLWGVFLAVLVIVGIPPGLQRAPFGQTSVLEAIPYLVPTTVLLFFVVNDWVAHPEGAPP